MARIGIGDYSIPASAYLAGIRAAKANPEAIFRRTLKSWAPGTGADVMREYRADLHHRINSRGGVTPRRSRVHPADWGMIATPRVILAHHTIRSLNRHQRPRLIARARTIGD